MRVCVDIQAAVSQGAGVGRYTRKLVEHLAPLTLDEDELRLFSFDFKRQGNRINAPNAQQHTIRWMPGRFAQQGWKRFEFPPFNWFAGKADVYHFPNFVRPPLTRGKSVVTIHDLSYLRFPETMEAKNLAYQRAKIGRTVKVADAIITDCQFVADELAEELKVPRERLHPIPLGLDPAMRHPGEAAIQALRVNHKIDRPYLLHLGTLEPRKNHLFLFDVFERAQERGQFDGDLLLVGGRGWKSDPIVERIDANPRIRHLGYLADGELPALYAGADAFLFPSLYEGFGFPPLEAMQCGTPVLSSSKGSLAEVLGEGATQLPLDIDAWVDALDKLPDRETGRPSSQCASQWDNQWASQYTWEETARKTLTVYRSLL